MKKLVLTFPLLFSLNAFSQIQVIADCVTPDNTGGVTLFTNAEQLVIQVARIDESMDEFIANQGPVSPAALLSLKLPTDRKIRILGHCRRRQ